MIKKFWKQILFIAFVVLLTVVCNLLAIILIKSEQALSILSIVSTVVSILLSVIALFYTFISGLGVSSTFESIQLQIKDLMQYTKQVSQLYDKIAVYKQDIDNGKATDLQSEELGKELGSLNQSLKAYYDIFN